MSHLTCVRDASFGFGQLKKERIVYFTLCPYVRVFVCVPERVVCVQARSQGQGIWAGIQIRVPLGPILERLCSTGNPCVVSGPLLSEFSSKRVQIHVECQPVWQTAHLFFSYVYICLYYTYMCINIYIYIYVYIVLSICM